MKVEEHARLVKRFLEQDPLRFNQIRKKTGLEAAQLKRAIDFLMKRGEIQSSVILTSAGSQVIGYSMSGLSNDLSERMRYFIEAREIVQGATIQLILSKEVNQIIKEYLPANIETTGRAWDSFVSLRKAFEKDEESEVEPLNPLEEIAVCLHDATLKLTDLIVKSLERKKVEALGKAQKDLYKLFVKNVHYFRFLEERFHASVGESCPTLDIALSEDSSELGQTLSRIIRKLPGLTTEEKLKTFFSNFHSEHWPAIHDSKLGCVPLSIEEMKSFKQLEVGSKIASKIQDEVEDEADKYSEDCMLISSLRPFEQIGLREKIIRSIRVLNREELSNFTIIIIRNELVQALDFLKIWPKEGPVSTNYERVCTPIIWTEILAREKELNRQAKWTLQEYRRKF